MTGEDIKIVEVGVDDTRFQEAILDLIQTVDIKGEDQQASDERKDLYSNTETIRGEIMSGHHWLVAVDTTTSRVVGCIKHFSHEELENTDPSKLYEWSCNWRVYKEDRHTGAGTLLAEEYKKRALQRQEETQKKVMMTLGVTPGTGLERGYEYLGFRDLILPGENVPEPVTEEYPWRNMVAPADGEWPEDTPMQKSKKWWQVWKR